MKLNTKMFQHAALVLVGLAVTTASATIMDEIPYLERRDAATDAAFRPLLEAANKGLCSPTDLTGKKLSYSVTSPLGLFPPVARLLGIPNSGTLITQAPEIQTITAYDADGPHVIINELSIRAKDQKTGAIYTTNNSNPSAACLTTLGAGPG